MYSYKTDVRWSLDFISIETSSHNVVKKKERKEEKNLCQHAWKAIICWQQTSSHRSKSKCYSACMPSTTQLSYLSLKVAEIHLNLKNNERWLAYFLRNDFYCSCCHYLPFLCTKLISDMEATVSSRQRVVKSCKDKGW